MAESAKGNTPFDICSERYSIEDIRLVMSSQPSSNDIRLLDGKTKLFDLVTAMKDIEQFRSVLNEHSIDINTSVPEDSPVLPGFTPLHLAVIVSKQPKNTQKRELNEDLRLIEECLSRGASVTAKDAFGSTPLHLAFHHQRTRAIEKLLQCHPSAANPVDKYNLSHLHIACGSGDEEVVKSLLEAGADPNLRVLSLFKFHPTGQPKVVQIHAGSTPLHIAVAVMHTKLARILVDSGANVNVADENGATPIHCLLVQESPDTGDERAKILLAANPTPMTVSGAGITHLHVASFFDHADAVERLLDLGTDVDARLGSQSELDDLCNRYNGSEYSTFSYRYYGECTAFVVAEWELALKALEILLTRGADVLLKSRDGRCPLYDTLKSENWQESFTLLARSMKVNDSLAKRIEEEFGLTVLHAACIALDVTSVRQLIGSVNVNAQLTEMALDLAGSTCLHMLVEQMCREGCESRIVEITEILLAAGADVTLCNVKGWTPLHMWYPDFTICDGGENRMLMNLMLSSTKDFRVNPTDDRGWSHFFLACFTNNDEVVKKYLKHGVTIDKPDATGRTATHKIVSAFVHHISKTIDYKELIKRLSNLGCDVDAQDDSGKTALHLAAEFKDAKAIAALLMNGADVNIVDRFGRTAFTYGADFCKCGSKKKHRHNDVIGLFVYHLKKMSHFNLYIDNVNRNTMSKVVVRPGFEAYDMTRFHKEAKKISLVKCEKNLGFKLIDLLSETGLVAVYPFKASIRFSIDKFFRGINVYLAGYTEIIGLIQYQIRKAVKRVELIDPVAEALNEAVGFPFPETCSFIVFRHLSNSDMENFIRAVL